MQTTQSSLFFNSARSTKTFLALFLTMLLSVFSFAPVAHAADHDPITMPNAELRECVNKEIDPTRDAAEVITELEAAGVTELACTYKEIDDISGLEHFDSLTDLRLYENKITDLTPLAGLTSLKYLDLVDNLISDIDKLSALSSLETLWISENNISDISHLQSLSSLKQLDLSENNLSDLTGIEGLTQLVHLYLESNSISDITKLHALTNLEELFLDDNLITDVSSLVNLVSLDSLSIQSNGLSDLTPIASLTSLGSLFLDDNNISNADSLVSLINLRGLQLSENQLTDISALASMHWLEYLYLDGNHISDFSSFDSPNHPDVSATDQTIFLGEIIAGVSVSNPVVTVAGEMVPLSDLYDNATNTFTPIVEGPNQQTAWTNQSGAKWDWFSGTIYFNVVEKITDEPGVEPGDEPDDGSSGVPGEESGVEPDGEPGEDLAQNGDTVNPIKITEHKAPAQEQLANTGVNGNTLLLMGVAALSALLMGSFLLVYSRRFGRRTTI